MDILSARKKAAQQKAKKEKKQEGFPVVQPAAVQQPLQADAPAAAAAPAAVSVVPDKPAVAPESAAEQAPPPADPPAEPQTQELEMLSFRLGVEEYALMVDDVKEVLKNRDLTPVPNSPDYVLGVTSLRGLILPVIDLCKRLGIPPGVRDEKSRILVVHVNDEDAGVLVDRVTGVVRIDSDSLRPAPDSIEHGSEYLRGIARREDILYILLDMEKALGMESGKKKDEE